MKYIKKGKRRIYNYIKKYFNLPKCYEMQYFHYKYMEILESNEIKIIVTEDKIEITTYEFIKEEDIKISRNRYVKEGKIEL